MESYDIGAKVTLLLQQHQLNHYEGDFATSVALLIRIFTKINFELHEWIEENHV
jgi:hypothetical protein